MSGEDVDKDMKETKKDMLERLGVTPEEAEQFSGGDMPPAFEVLNSYLPSSDETGEKSRYVASTMPTNFTALMVLAKVYPELSTDEIDMEEVIGDWIESFEKRLASVEGESREEFEKILRSMFGGYRQQQNRNKDMSSMMQELFTTGQNSGEESG